MKQLKDVVRSRREDLGISQAELGRRSGMSQQAIVSIESGDTLRPRRLVELAGALGLSPEELAASSNVDQDAVNERMRTYRDRGQNIVLARPSRLPKPPLSAPMMNMAVALDFSALPKDVAVLGTAAGGADGDFLLNGETIDYVRRPPGILTASGTFALYVTGESMWPRYDEGQLVYVSNARAPSIGDDVIVELLPEQEGEAGRGYIKRLKKRTPTKLIVEQFNPPTEIEFDVGEVKQVFRIIPWNELLVV